MPEAQLLKSGDRIRHSAYGKGIVLKVWRSGRELVAKVRWVEDHNATFAVVITDTTVIIPQGE